jgi:hypothetical protein
MRTGRLLVCYLLLLALFLGPTTAECPPRPKAEAFRQWGLHAVREIGRPRLNPQLTPPERLSLERAATRVFARDFGTEPLANPVTLLSKELKEADPSDEWRLYIELWRSQDPFAFVPGAPGEPPSASQPSASRVGQVSGDPNGLSVGQRVRIGLRVRPDESAESMSARAIDDVAARIFDSIVRRNEIIESANARVIRDLEPLYSPADTKSELKTFLEQDLKLKDATAVAQSFDANVMVQWVELKEEMTLLRLFGGDSGALGRYFFCCLESSSDETYVLKPIDVSGLATPPGNSLDNLAIVRVPAGTRALIGTVADNFRDNAGQVILGGATQIFIPHIGDVPYEHLIRDDRGTHLKEIFVVFDNGRVGRFRP